MVRRGASVKDSKPIPLPHDGPLAQLLAANNGGSHEAGGGGDDKNDRAQESSTLEQQSLQLLQRHTARASSYDYDSSMETPASDRLLHALLHASSIEEQLQALQRFKGTILQQQRASLADDRHDKPWPLCRILLEFSLSLQTPAPLRRALQSTLDAVVAQRLQHSSDDDDAPPWTQEIIDNVLATILDDADSWSDSLTALQYALSYAPTAERIPPSTAISILYQHSQTVVLDTTQWSKTILANVNRAAQIATIFKSLAAIPYESHELPLLQDFFRHVIQFTSLPVDHLRIVVVAYGKAQQWTADNLQLLLRGDTLIPLSEIQQAALLQGVLASIDNDILWKESSAGNGNDESFLKLFLAKFKGLAMQSPDPHIRLAALKGIQTLLSHCFTADVNSPRDNELYAFLTDETLQIVLHAWENPDRRLANSLPSIFQAIVRLMRQQPEPAQLRRLVQKIVQQAPHRKGRYIALETLLPETGAQVLLDAAGPGLIDEFLLGIADYGHNTVAIADLWAKLLQSLLQEQMCAASVEMTMQPVNRKERRKQASEQSQRQPSVDKTQLETVSSVLDGWMKLWIPSLALALVKMETTRRKQVAAFCLSRVMRIVGDCKYKACAIYQSLFYQTNALLSGGRIDLPVAERDTLDDRVMWASIEYVLAASKDGLIVPTSDNDDAMGQLKHTIATFVTPTILSLGLVHTSSLVRSSAFRSIAAIVACQKDDSTSLALAEEQYWKGSLAFAAKDIEPHYLTHLFCSLANFFDRLLVREAECSSKEELSIFSRFMIDFLIDDMILTKTVYPGSPKSKSMFGLALLECVIVFSARDCPCAKMSKLLPKSGAAFTRTRLAAEETALSFTRQHLLSTNVFLAIISLLSSPWDDTRSKALSSLQALIQLAKQYIIELPYPVLFRGCDLENRAVYLASSPRQHECDTGAKLILLLFLMCPTDSEQQALFGRIVSLIRQRIDHMAEMLTSILAGQPAGNAIPLAHGLLRGTRMIIDEAGLSFNVSPSTVCSDLAELLQTALQLSLSVIADVDDIPIIDSGSLHCKQHAVVNPGALGANGITGSLKRITATEQTRQMMSQRLVIGSWLLTKETCEMLACLLIVKGVMTDPSSFERAGALLITTQISVKHTGAAYAAHNALQKLSEACFDSDNDAMEILPRKWMMNLLNRVCDTARVRNSTLRRSTGYALGFLALMRSEVSSCCVAQRVGKEALARLLSMSLPPAAGVNRLLDCLKLPRHQPLSCFVNADDRLPECADKRIHAMNIVRMILLDAPLFGISTEAAGDAFLTSVIGYLDSQWSIRNSATMVFSAAMLRCVDPDKNAVQVDNTSNRAASISELFKAYPSLSDFVQAILVSSVSGSLASKATTALPPGLPLMILLARVQPVRTSGADAAFQTEQMIAPLLEATKHKHIAIRNGAARALANLACGNFPSPASPSSLLKLCRATLTDSGRSLNQVHGALCLILELLKTRAIIEEHLVERFLPPLIAETAFRFASGRPLAPPLIMSTAFSILRLTGDDDLIRKSRAAVTAWLETGASGVGIAELGAIIGAGSCEDMLPIVWQTGRACSSIETDLAKLLLSPSFDIRCAAIKTFKKSIYDGTDRLLASADDHQMRLESLCRLLIGSLVGELDTWSHAHPPNVRRLSRCLLECLSAQIRSNGDYTLEAPLQEALWSVARMMAGGRNVIENGEQGFTALEGNAVELMSFVIRERTRSDADICLFQDLVTRLSDSYMPWKLRHSAASAISTSKVLHVSHPGSSKQWRLGFVSAAIHLFQDADADVRHAIAVPLCKFLNIRTERKSQLVPLPECILQTTMSDAASANALARPSDVIMFTLAFTDTLLQTMDAYMSEFYCLDTSPVGLLNTALDRKIFEEEVPNDYAEMAFPIQLMVRQLTTVENFVLAAEDVEAALLLQRKCEAVLSLLAMQPSLNSDVFDVTSDRRVLPQLHSLLLVLGVLMCYVEEGKRQELQMMSEKICQTFVHPLIRNALDVISDTQLDSQTRRQKVAGCCFLVNAWESPL